MTSDRAIAIILSAGNSQRMGLPKWKLSFSDEQTFLERLAEVYSLPMIRNLVLVINQQQKNAVEALALPANTLMVENENPALGRNHSIKLALDRAKKHDFAFVQNIDNPFTTAHLIETMWTCRAIDGATLPVCGQKEGHPVLLGPMLCTELRQKPPASYHFREWLANQHKTLIQTHNSSILANINTQEEYSNFQNFFRK
jgi:CTP:molybdopterin cytidylyltransferase MocA